MSNSLSLGMISFATPQDYVNAVLPFLSPLSHNLHYLHPQAVNETIEACMATEHADILKETGDALFYFFVPATALPNTETPMPVITADEWTSRTMHEEDAQSEDAARREALEAVVIYGGQWAKTIREPDTKHARIAKMGDQARIVLLALKDLANHHGASLKDVAELNYAKLADRAQRGVLTGDGSNR